MEVAIWAGNLTFQFRRSNPWHALTTLDRSRTFHKNLYDLLAGDPLKSRFFIDMKAGFLRLILFDNVFQMSRTF
jgi:hypothetical protein